ncbi:coiled-coil domain-containing protein 172 [Antennarius striatus]|uniref:coiled-coil domain-containing protein 172 n=1 Tax=Antennarius striatus TaxID=241820 RepID=UPI0035AE807E
MSLDSLFQQILLSEQELTERRRKLKEVRVSINGLSEQIKSCNEKRRRTAQDLDQTVNTCIYLFCMPLVFTIVTAQQLSEMKLQHKLLKRRHQDVLKACEELLVQRGHLQERLAGVRRDRKEQEKHFCGDISAFNRAFSLQGDGQLLLHTQMHRQMLDLDRELGSLHREMELMSSRSPPSAVQEERGALQVELQALDRAQRALDQQLRDAEATTAALTAEHRLVQHRPQTDSKCLSVGAVTDSSCVCSRLRQELQEHQEAELELLREALRSEIHFVQSVSL